MGNSLVGREEACGIADRAVAALARGRAGGVLVLGEAGIGKTRVLAELAARARRAELPVLAGRASEFETDVPLGVLAAALDDTIAARRDALVAALGPERVALLAPVLATLDGSGVRERAPDVSRAGVHAAARTLLETLARRGGLVLVLDDLQWADAASVDLIAHFLRRPPRHTLLALGARSAGLPPAIARSIERATRDRAGVAAVIELAPLTEAQAATLVGAEHDPARAKRWFAESGGNPFYLEALMRAGDVPAGDLPTAVAAAMAAEIDPLDARVQQVARAAAVAGDPVELGLVAAAAGIDERAALDAVQALLAADVLRETSRARDLRFRAPIVRRAIYDATPHGDRLAAHERLVTHLRAHGAPPAAIAHHLAVCATPGDDSAIQTLAEAALAVSSAAPSSAAVWFDAVLRLLPDTPENTIRRVALLARRAICLGAAGQLDASREALRDVVSRLPRDGSRERGDAVAFGCAIDTLLGKRPEALATIEREIADLPADDCPAAPLLYLQHAALCVYAARMTQARTSALLARAGARRSEPPLQAYAAAMDAMTAYCVADIAGARRAADEAAALLDRLSDADLATRLEAVGWLGWTEYFLGRYQQATAHFARGRDVATGAGQEYVLIGILCGWSLTSLSSGRLADSEQLRDAAFETAAVIGHPHPQAWAFSADCQAQLLRGDVPAALASAERGAALLGPDHDGVAVLIQGLRAEALVESGRPDEGREVLLDAAGGPGMPFIERPYRPRWLEVLVRAELDAGRLDQAQTWASAAEDAVAGSRLDVRAADAARCRAAVQLAAGDDAAAAQSALTAADLAAAGSAPIDEARARLLAGRAFAAGGHTDAAIEACTAAHRLAGDSGAGRLVDDAARELRQLGRRVPRAARQAIASRAPATAPANDALVALSPREREIADLICGGATNAAISVQLHLSRRTVETHVRHIFEKLDVSSRAAIAAAVAQQRAATAS